MHDLLVLEVLVDAHVDVHGSGCDVRGLSRETTLVLALDKRLDALIRCCQVTVLSNVDELLSVFSGVKGGIGFLGIHGPDAGIIAEEYVHL